MQARILAQRICSTKKSVLLLGPRQVGKSTLTQQLNPGLTVNLADETLFIGYSRDAGLLKREIDSLEKPTLIVIDEIQRVPALLNTVQLFCDQKTRHRFILTGSSARKLKRGGANLLPGRIVLEYLDPLSYWELKDCFNLKQALQYGTLPEIYLEKDLDVLGTYASVYLREEIQMEAQTKNIGAYARFLDVAALSSGDWINYSKFANDTEIPKETIRRYFSLLEDTLLIFKIPPYKARGTSRRISHNDRYVFFDIGVRNALLKVHKQPPHPAEYGKLFEQWIILQCIYFIHAHKKEWQWFAYRTENGAEVDLILDTGKALLAIECKSGKHASESDMRGLRSFEEIAKGKIHKYVVYQGEKRQKFSKGELAVPYDDFLMNVLPNVD